MKLKGMDCDQESHLTKKKKKWKLIFINFRIKLSFELFNSSNLANISISNEII